MSELIKKIFTSRYSIHLLIGFSILITCIWDYSRRKQATPSRKNESLDLDTVIPQGFVLIPLELQNVEALDPLVGEFAVIDLHVTDEMGQKNTLVGKRVRLVRAPHQREKFAVLVPESTAPQVSKHQGRFWAVLRNRAENGTEVSHENRPSRIRYY